MTTSPFLHPEPTFSTIDETMGVAATVIETILKTITDYPLISGSRAIEVPTLVEETTISDINYISPSTYKLDSGYNYYTDFYEDITKKQANIIEPGLPNLYIYGDDLNKESNMDLITVEGQVKIDATEDVQYEYFDTYAKQYQKFASSQADRINPFLQLSNIQTEIYYTKNLLNRIEDVNKNQFLVPYGNKISFKTNQISTFSGMLDSSDFVDLFCNSFASYSKQNFKPLQLAILTEKPVKINDKVETQQTIENETVLGIKYNSISSFTSSLKQIMNQSPNLFSVGDTTKKKTNPQVSLASSGLMSRKAVVNQSNSLSRTIRTAVFLKRLNSFIESVSLDVNEFLDGYPFYTEAFMYELVKSDETGNVLQTFYMPNLIGIENINLFDSQVKFGKKYLYTLNAVNFSLEQEINLDSVRTLNAGQWAAIVRESIKLDPRIAIILEKIVRKERPPASSTTGTLITTRIPSSVISPSVPTLPNLSQFVSNIENNLDILRDDSLSPEESKIFIKTILRAIQNHRQDLRIDIFTYKPVFFKKALFSDIMAVYDYPPSPPEIEIDGMMGIDNKIFLRLNGSISEFKAIPVIIQPEDTEIFDRNVLTQKLKNTEQLMTFDGDDRPMTFQIFKLDHQPSSYSEFKDQFVTASTTYVDDTGNVNCEACNIVRANHSSYVDDIQPNKKYYYIFRTVDVHGNISNPSPIYEVEIVNENGTIFPLIKTVDLLKVDNREPAKTVRRFLHIIPNTLQTLINEKESDYYDENEEIKESADLVKEKVVLGLTEDKVWNKTFRLKIKSKVTGKVVEIDFKYTHKTLPNPAICE